MPAQAQVETDARVANTQDSAVIIAGHAFMQDVRRGSYELAVDAPPAMRVAAAFAELGKAI